MSRLSYIYLLIIIGFALLLHAADEKATNDAIQHAASIALHDGVLEACEQRNHLRDSVGTLALELHAEARRDQVRIDLNYENCDELADQSVKNFFFRLNQKP